MNRQQRIETITLAPPRYVLAAIFAAFAFLFIHQQALNLAVIAGLLAILAGNGAKTLSVDIQHRRFQIGRRLFGLTAGDWQTLPPTQRVVMRYFSDLAVSSGDGGGMEYDQNSRYIILLSSLNSRKATIVTEISHYEQAVQVSCFLGLVLGIEVISVNKYKQKKVLQEADPSLDILNTKQSES